MKLSHKELEIQSGQFGEVRKLALEHQMQVGKFFDAQSFVEISQVHIMADTEALGLAGIEYLENLTQYPDPQKQVWVPTITDPRGSDFKSFKKIKQNKRLCKVYDEILIPGCRFLTDIQDNGVPFDKLRLVKSQSLMQQQIDDAIEEMYKEPAIRKFEEINGKDFNPNSTVPVSYTHLTLPTKA